MAALLMVLLITAAQAIAPCPMDTTRSMSAGCPTIIMETAGTVAVAVVISAAHARTDTTDRSGTAATTTTMESATFLTDTAVSRSVVAATTTTVATGIARAVVAT